MQELLVELGWASKSRAKVEEEEGGSAQMEGGSGEDCDDEDGCEASGEENGELKTRRQLYVPIIEEQTLANTRVCVCVYTRVDG